MPSTLVGGGDFLLRTLDSIFAPEDFDSDSRLMIETARQFCLREVMPNVERLEAQEDGLMPALLKHMGELGLAGPETPEEFGGLGLSKALGTRILEMLSLNGSFSTTVAVHMGIGQSPIYLWGTQGQKEKYLPKLASGEWMSAYALSEPNTGSDALGLSTRAVRDGGDFLLTGTKMWISNAKWAKTFITFAKTEGDRVSAFIVERDFEGVSIGPEEHKTGLKGSSTARMVLDGARVPVENLLYREGEGHRVAFNALNLGRLKLGSMSLGPARSAMHYAAEYAKDRKQFGQPIASFGLIRDKFARMAALFFACESVMLRTAALVDSAFEAVDKHSADLADENRKAAEVFAMECSANKVLCTEMLAYVSDEALQIHGGYGFTEEFPVARVWRDARVTRIYEGTNEINRVFLFDRIVKRGLLQSLLTTSPQSFTHEMLIECARVGAESKSQEVTGALSDLVILHYALQSAQARARKAGAFGEGCARMYESIANASAARYASEVFARCGASRSVAVPPADYSSADSIAQALLDADGYPIAT